MADPRTFKPLMLKSGGYFPYENFAARQDVFLKNGARRARVMGDRKKLEPVVIRILPDQDFSTKATGWEFAWSKLVSLRNAADPVLTKDWQVAGHLGWFPGDMILKPVGLSRYGIDECLKNEVALYVTRRNPMTSYWESLGVADQSYNLFVTVDGLVLAKLGYRNRDGAVAEMSPLDFLIPARLTATVGRAGGRMILWAFTRKGAERTVALGVTETASVITASKAGSEVAEEGVALVAQARSAGRPAVVNLGGTGEVKGAINLNPNKVAPRKDIPNLVAREGEEIGEVFGSNSVDEIVSNRLPPNTLDWGRVLPGAHKILKPGGKIIIRFQGVGDDAKVIMEKFRELGFKETKNYAGAALEGVK